MPPSVTAIDGGMRTGLAGHEVTLSFTITQASPLVEPSDIQWTYFNDSTGIAELVNLTKLGSRFALSEDRLKLTISNIDVLDGGIYSLYAQNAAGADNVSVFLIIYGKLLRSKSPICYWVFIEIMKGE